MQNLNTTPPSSTTPLNDDLMLLLNYGMGKPEMTNMLFEAKKTYVLEHHNRNIYQMTNATGYRKGNWKTYIYEDGKRKGVEKKSEKEIIEFLYSFYRAQEALKPKTLKEVFLMLEHKKEYSLSLSKRTLSEDSRYFSFLSSDMQEKRVDEISESDIREWLVKEFMPKKPKPESLRKMLQLLTQIFREGQSRRLCPFNPASSISYRDYVKNCDLHVKTDEEKAFSLSEIKQLQDAAWNIWEKQKNPRALMIIVSIETGIRAGEIPVLHKTDVGEKFLHVHRQQLIDKSTGHEQFYEVGYTKNERHHPRNGRKVPISEECKRALACAAELEGDSDYVFHDKSGSAISKNSYELFLRRLCKRMGFKATNNHAFRFSYNSRLIDCNISAADRALILGHQVATNEHRYSITEARKLDSIYEKLQNE